MAGPLSGPGVGLPYPQALYPQSLYNGETVPSTNTLSLAPGQIIPIPRGTFMVDTGGYGVYMIRDPVTSALRPQSSARQGPIQIQSDGFNHFVGNMLGCAVAAIVVAGGTGYVAGSTTLSPSAGNSQWQPIVGGLLNNTISISSPGAGYTVPPIVAIPTPPSPGVAASAIAIISSGTVSSITVLNQGAGYPSAPPISILPNPLDPAYLSGAITANATAVATLTGSGALTAALCLNPGSSFTTVPSLTVAGAGTGATVTIVPLWTLASTSITSGGAGYGGSSELSTIGGQPSATPAYTNPATELTGYIPRKASGALVATGGTISSVSTIYDSGMFTGTPTMFVAGGTTSATITGTLGTKNITVIIQPLGN
jgi:hypothetical protein